MLFNSRNSTHVTLFDHSYDAALEQFLSSAPRYRLAVLKVDSSAREENALNIGLELTKAIERLDRHDEMAFQFAVQEAISRIVKEHIITDPVLGEVVVIENPGILFEPALRIDVSDVLQRISRNTLTILLWPGEIAKEKLSFLSTSSVYHIKQSETNYIIL